MNNIEIKNSLTSFHLPPYEEIPDVGLYLEQVARYINGFLVDFPELQVTTSMISNYAKAKLFERVNKKTYTRDQIATLLFITLSKSVMSIDYVRTALTLCRDKKYDWHKAYSYYRHQLQEALNDIFRPTSEKNTSGLSEDMIMLQNVCTAIAHKMYLERYFDALQQESKQKV